MAASFTGHFGQRPSTERPKIIRMTSFDYDEIPAIMYPTGPNDKASGPENVGNPTRTWTKCGVAVIILGICCLVVYFTVQNLVSSYSFSADAELNTNCVVSNNIAYTVVSSNPTEATSSVSAKETTPYTTTASTSSTSPLKRTSTSAVPLASTSGTPRTWTQVAKPSPSETSTNGMSTRAASSIVSNVHLKNLSIKTSTSTTSTPSVRTTEKHYDYYDDSEEK